MPQIIESTISTLLDHLPEIVEAGVKLLTALITNLPQIILTIVQALPQIITAVINALVNNIPKIIETGVKLLTALITNLPQIIAEIVRAMPQIITGIVNALGEGVSQVAEVGANLVRGLWDGIQSLAGWLWDKVSGGFPPFGTALRTFSASTPRVRKWHGWAKCSSRDSPEPWTRTAKRR